LSRGLSTTVWLRFFNFSSATVIRAGGGKRLAKLRRNDPAYLRAGRDCGHAPARRPDEAILIKFCLASGFRDREIRYVTWRDVDFRNFVVRVTAKPLWKFKPKNYEERAVPLPAAMIEQLQRLRTQRNAAPAELIFPNSKGKPNSLHIEVVEEVAYRPS
jgi:integrase